MTTDRTALVATAAKAVARAPVRSITPVALLTAAAIPLMSEATFVRTVKTSAGSDTVHSLLSTLRCQGSVDVWGNPS